MIGINLQDAKQRGLKKYQNECKRHGSQAYAVLDNSCPRCVTEAAAKRRKNNYSFNRARELFNEIRNRASSNGVDFDLNLDDVRQLLESTDVCPYLGIEITLGHDNYDHRKSIDRVDPTKGYTMNNITVCSNRANRIKNNSTPQELLLLAANLQAMLGAE